MWLFYHQSGGGDNVGGGEHSVPVDDFLATLEIRDLTAQQAAQITLVELRRFARDQNQVQSFILERLAAMTDTFDQLTDEVGQVVTAEKARDQHIADLTKGLEDQTKVAQDALDRANLDDAQKADLQTQLDAATKKAQDAIAALEAANPGTAPGNTAPAPTPDPAVTPPTDPAAGQPTDPAVTPPTDTPPPADAPADGGSNIPL